MYSRVINCCFGILSSNVSLSNDKIECVDVSNIDQEKISINDLIYSKIEDDCHQWYDSMNIDGKNNMSLSVHVTRNVDLNTLFLILKIDDNTINISYNRKNDNANKNKIVDLIINEDEKHLHYDDDNVHYNVDVIGVNTDDVVLIELFSDSSYSYLSIEYDNYLYTYWDMYDIGSLKKSCVFNERKMTLMKELSHLETV